MGAAVTRLSCGCDTIVVPPTSPLARFSSVGRGKREVAGDGIGPDGCVTPKTKARSSSILGQLLARAEFARDSHRLGTAKDEEKRRLDEKFLEAARCGNFKELLEALSQGADARARTSRGQSALMLASAQSSKAAAQILAFLLQVGNVLDEADEQGWTPLLWACRNNNQEAAEMLIARNASVTAKAKDGKTAAMLAIMESGDDLTMLLISHKVGVGTKDQRGRTLIFYAIESERVEVVKWLLKKGAQADVKAKDFTTPLMVASHQGHIKIAADLLKRDANINAANLSGNTSIMLSVMAAQEKFAFWLSDKKADCSLRNRDGETAVSIAETLLLGQLKSHLDVHMRRALEEGKFGEADAEED